MSTTLKMISQTTKALGALIFILFLPNLGFGQKIKLDTIAQIPKWEVGLNLLGLFDENHVPKTSIFFRRNYDRTNQKCKALRFRVGLDSEIRDGYSHDGLLLGEYMTYSPYLSIGHEWKHYSKRQYWYMATELSGNYQYSNQYFLVSGDDFYYDVKIRDFDLALNGILGYQFNLTNKFAIGAESAFIVKYSEQHRDIVSNDSTTFGGGNYSNLTTSILPFMTINLIYSLQKNKKNVKN